LALPNVLVCILICIVTNPYINLKDKQCFEATQMEFLNPALKFMKLDIYIYMCVCVFVCGVLHEMEVPIKWRAWAYVFIRKTG
jgi:hypothetical protein